jgi:Condensation domain
MTNGPNQTGGGDEFFTFEYAMTPQQKRIWAACALSTSRYNAAFRVEISGLLEPELLRKSIGSVLRCHEALRSSCLATAEGPVVVVHDAASSALGHAAAEHLHETDLRSLNEADTQRHIERISTSDSRCLFDLLKFIAFICFDCAMTFPY